MPAVRDTFIQWLNGIKIAQVGHFQAAAEYNRRHYWIGIPAICFSIATSGSAFAALASSKETWILVLVGLFSLLNSILAGLQTFLNYPEVSAKHQGAGNRYGKLRKRVEELIATEKEDRGLEVAMKAIREEWDRLNDESPTVSQRHHDQAVRKVKGSM
jgi:hypothetical protein